MGCGPQKYIGFAMFHQGGLWSNFVRAMDVTLSWTYSRTSIGAWVDTDILKVIVLDSPAHCHSRRPRGSHASVRWEM